MLRPVRKLIFLIGVVAAFYAGLTFEQARSSQACDALGGTYANNLCTMSGN